ncbi:glycoside hydrolase family 72 protein [Periconia macrospinosa]|uniref:1,3-beta-glucanosyltransferase n=1 Tax=Periconia macrospinosa TaxID=97972 RepID=A0A2V1DZV5_9PLEO|nr:glycoside hydrolase family 72 protein [Periconia macrospinosa]
MRSVSQTLALAAALFTSVAVAVTPIEVQGRDFVDPTTQKRFMIVGADYQPGGQAGYKPQEKKDALSDKETCLRDAVVLQKLGVNTIRVYNVDPKLNHDDCASIFNAAGIYMIIDVNGPQSGESINRAEPWTSYHKDYLNRIFGVVENFKAYPNTLAFFAANEVMNDLKTGKINPQYIRAVQRDLKNYIKTHVDRRIPVAYSAADVREILEDTWAYMQCDNGDNSDSDFFGLNSYSWCGGSATFESAGYNTLVDMFKDSSVPVFFSEYGCNEVLPRVFDEVSALYSDKMKTLSGGLVYEYSQEDNKYGLADVNADGTIKLRADFENLQKAYAKLDLSKLEALQTPIKAPKCDAKLIKNSAFDSNFTIPALCPGCEDLIKNGIQNPTKGQIVEVKDTKCPKAVFGSKGDELKDLNLKLVSNDGPSVPSENKTNPAPTLTPSNSTHVLRQLRNTKQHHRSDSWRTICALHPCCSINKPAVRLTSCPGLEPSAKYQWSGLSLC